MRADQQRGEAEHHTKIGEDAGTTILVGVGYRPYIYTLASYFMRFGSPGAMHMSGLAEASEHRHRN